MNYQKDHLKILKSYGYFCVVPYKRDYNITLARDLINEFGILSRENISKDFIKPNIGNFDLKNYKPDDDEKIENYDQEIKKVKEIFEKNSKLNKKISTKIWILYGCIN